MRCSHSPFTCAIHMHFPSKHSPDKRTRILPADEISVTTSSPIYREYTTDALSALRCDVSSNSLSLVRQAVTANALARTHIDDSRKFLPASNVLHFTRTSPRVLVQAHQPGPSRLHLDLQPTSTPARSPRGILRSCRPVQAACWCYP
jgi:hypothetical protein